MHYNFVQGGKRGNVVVLCSMCLKQTKVIVKPSNDIPYVFGLDTSKFQKRYSFKFEDTLESVVEGLLKPYEKVGERV